jgi:hypothetical protein
MLKIAKSSILRLQIVEFTVKLLSVLFLGVIWTFFLILKFSSELSKIETPNKPYLAPSAEQDNRF